MGQVLHGRATTTEAVRRAILHRQESLRARAKRSGIKQKTVAKGKKRKFGCRSANRAEGGAFHGLGACQEFRVWGCLMGLKEPPMARRKDPVLREALLDRLPGGVDAKSAFDGVGRPRAERGRWPAAR